MFGRRFGWGFSLIGVLLIVAAAVGVGYLAYNAGVTHGVAQAAELPAGELPQAYGAPYLYRPFGIGLGLFGCLVPLALFFLLFGGIRMLFLPWRMRRWGRGFGHGWGDKHPERWERFREQAEKWHKEMHDAGDGPDQTAEV